MKNPKKREQPKGYVDAVLAEPSSEYVTFERTLKGLLAVPKSRVDTIIKKEKQARKKRSRLTP